MGPTVQPPASLMKLPFCFVAFLFAAVAQMSLGQATTGPVITGFSPATITAGVRVVITGSGLSGVTAVKFNGVDAASFSLSGASQIVAIVPAGVPVGNGLVTVVSSSGSASSGTSFEYTRGPVITVNPAPNRAVTAGVYVPFAPVVFGEAPLTYQWNKSGVPIWGATLPFYSILAADKMADEGEYTVTVSNAFGSATSAPAVLKVLEYTTPYTISAVAGQANVGATDGSAQNAFFARPGSVAVDSSGNIYVADSANHTIRKMTPDGTVSTLAGLAGYAGDVDGVGSAARFSSPGGIAVDNEGNVYVADTGTHTIRKVQSATGEVSTFAGARTAGFVDGMGAAARFFAPLGLAWDSTRQCLYVADQGNVSIRQVTKDGVVTTLAGTGSPGNIDGDVSVAQFSAPRAVAVNSEGVVYVADSGGRTIRKIDNGVVSLVAGSPGVLGSQDGPALFARFSNPWGLAFDSNDDLYVSDASNHTIRKISHVDGFVTTVAGVAGASGNTDGPLMLSTFSAPAGLAWDGDHLIVADQANSTLRAVSTDGVVFTIAGRRPAVGSTDGVGSAARFRSLGDIALDAFGNVYIADSGNHTIRKIDVNGTVSTFAGTSGRSGSSDGPITTARFNSPRGIAVVSSGDNTVIYVADTANHAIRKIANGTVTTIAGVSGTSGFANGNGGAALFLTPTDIAIDSTGGILYVTDAGNHIVRKIDTGYIVSTLAGVPRSSGYVDGTPDIARFNSPWALDVGADGSIYVSDRANSAIRKITPSGTVSTLVANLAPVTTVAVQGDNTVYASGFTFIIRITPDGAASALCGVSGSAGGALGTGDEARFANITGLDVTSSGVLYIADGGNNVIRKGAERAPAWALRDFSGEGSSDVLLRNTASGGYGAFLLGEAYSFAGSGTVPLPWNPLAVADFNQDRHSDVVWRNMETGEIGVILMNRAVPVSFRSFGAVDLVWTVVGVGDLNQDSQTDICWQNSSTGEVGYWAFSGTNISGYIPIGPLPPPWVVAGAGDFNHDRKTDLLCFNTTSRDLIVAVMDSGAAVEYKGVTNLPAPWRVVGVADFNNDLSADLLLWNETTRTTGVWMLDGTAVTHFTHLADLPESWQPH